MVPQQLPNLRRRVAGRQFQVARYLPVLLPRQRNPFRRPLFRRLAHRRWYLPPGEQPFATVAGVCTFHHSAPVAGFSTFHHSPGFVPFITSARTLAAVPAAPPGRTTRRPGVPC